MKGSRIGYSLFPTPYSLLPHLVYDDPQRWETFMIVCPNCNHQNPDGAVQCEACYTPLPASTVCSNCGASVQSDASFCGQCGFNLKAAVPTPGVAQPSVAEVPAAIASSPPNLPELIPPDPLVMPEPITPEPAASEPAASEPAVSEPVTPAASGSGLTPPEIEPSIAIPDPDPITSTQSVGSVKSAPLEPMANVAAASGMESQTQLQQQTARLLHVQTNALIELPQGLSVIHIGKPNDRIPPDIDLSGFPNSEIVSRIHADIRLEADAYYVEDVGSSNGTYINNLPLTIGNRHRLRPGDRIALGKGDKVTFLFQLS